MQKDELMTQLKALQSALKELRPGAPNLVDPKQTVANVYAFLDSLESEHADLFATKPTGSASTYAQLYANIKAVKNDKYLNIPQLVQFLRTLRDEQTGGRRKTRRRKLSRKRTSKRRTH